MATPSTYLNLNNAAKYSGWNKSTLSKAIKTGKLPVKEKVGNQYFIDPSDLERVFPKKTTEFVESTKIKHGIKQLATEETTLKIRELELKLEHALEKNREQSDILEREREAHAATKAEKKKLLDTLDNQTKLLTHQQETIIKSAEKPVESKKGFFATLLGK